MQHLARGVGGSCETGPAVGGRQSHLICCSSFLRTSERDVRRRHVFAARETQSTAFGNGINVDSEVTEWVNTLKH